MSYVKCHAELKDGRRRKDIVWETYGAMPALSRAAKEWANRQEPCHGAVLNVRLEPGYNGSPLPDPATWTAKLVNGRWIAPTGKLGRPGLEPGRAARSASFALLAPHWEFLEEKKKSEGWSYAETVRRALDVMRDQGAVSPEP